MTEYRSRRRQRRWLRGVVTGATLAAVAALAGCAGASPAPGLTALEARVQRLEDAEAIRALLRDYGRHLDARDFAAWAALFAEDGEWLGGLGRVRGRHALERMLADALPGEAPAPGAGSHHLFANKRIDVHGDTATAQSRWVFLLPGGERPAVAMLGRYDDELVRVDGRWQFRRRVVTTEIPHHDPLAD